MSGLLVRQDLDSLRSGEINNNDQIKCLNGGMSSSAICFLSKARHSRKAGGQISKLALNIPYLFIDLYRYTYPVSVLPQTYIFRNLEI